MRFHRPAALMPNPHDYLLKIRALGWDGLDALWTAIRMGRTPGWEPGKAFEHLVLRAFELEGAEVRWPYTVSIGDIIIEQIDGAVYAAGLACLVEAKDSSRLVSIDAVAKLRQQLSRRPPGVVGLMFSRTLFTEPAVKLAQYLAPQNILLWTGTDLAYALERREMIRALEMKYRYCVEYGLPSLGLALEERV